MKVGIECDLGKAWIEANLWPALVGKGVGRDEVALNDVGLGEEGGIEERCHVTLYCITGEAPVEKMLYIYTRALTNAPADWRRPTAILLPRGLEVLRPYLAPSTLANKNVRDIFFSLPPAVDWVNWKVRDYRWLRR